MQNFRKGVAGRLGLDAKTLREHNPRLIYASATGYGREGPDSGEPSFDFLGLARSGMMYAAGDPEGPPLPVAGAIADQLGGMMLAYGVMTALVVRERTGIAQDVDASHLGSMAYLQGLSLSMRLMMGFAMPRMKRENATQCLWNHYECKDGKWIALAMLQADRYWGDFARALGRPDLVEHEKFKDMASRAMNGPEVVATLDEVFRTKTRDEWMQTLRDAPGDFIYTVVQDLNELADDPQMRINDYIVEFDHPQHGPTEMVGIPVQFSETRGEVVRAPAPELGQHTEEVLMDVLGWDWDRIAALREREVV